MFVQKTYMYLYTPAKYCEFLTFRKLLCDDTFLLLFVMVSFLSFLLQIKWSWRGAAVI